MNNRKIYYGIFAVLCVAGLAVGLAGAAGVTGAVTGGNGTNCGMNGGMKGEMNRGMYGGIQGGMHGGMQGSGGQYKAMEQKITCLENRGIDVTELKAAYAKGDTESIRAWFTAFHESQPDGTRGGCMSGTCTGCASR